MKRFLSALNNKPTDRPPFWYMRQAGRYLPEYLATRKKQGGFLDLVYSPEDAIEVTMQPIRRYHMDAAILFSDILVIPDALGQSVSFNEGIGPVLEPIRDLYQLSILNMDNLHQHLNPVYETLKGLKKQLPDDVALIGFAGAPWTVATYMVGGRGSKDHEDTKNWAYGDEKGFQKLIDILVTSTTEYLLRQVESGAEALQIFDTWAGSLSETAFIKWSIEPTKQIVANVKAKYPDIPIIGFPRGAGVRYINYIKQTGVDAVSLDGGVPVKWAADELQPLCPVQGNLDPRLLVVGGKAMLDEADRIMRALSPKGFVFNLGHGITPDVPPENVAELSDFIRNWKA